MNYSFRSFQSQSDLSFRKLAKSCNIQDPSIYFQFSPRKYYFNRVHFTKITRHKIGIFQSITCPVQDYSSTRASETIEMEDSFFDQRQVRTLSIGATSGARMISFPITDRSPGIIIFSSSRYGSRA